MTNKAMVLAAGLGKRMRPLTDMMPKPLVPVAGRKLVDHTLDWLHASGVREAVVNTHYKADMLEAHLATRAQPVISISREAQLLETGGGIFYALPLLGAEPFVVVNSDSICVDTHTPALESLRAKWDDAALDALLLVYPVERAIGYDGVGDFFFEAGGTLRRRAKHPSAPYVFTGVQLLHPRMFATAPAGAFSMNLLYDRNIGNDGTLARIGAVVHDGAWLHVGDPDGLKKAEAFFAAR